MARVHLYYRELKIKALEVRSAYVHFIWLMVET